MTNPQLHIEQSTSDSGGAGSRPLAVTVVFGSGELGGAELWLLDLLAATGRLRARALLLSGGPLQDELRRRGVPVAVRARTTGASATAIAFAVRDLAARLRADRPDLVLANGVKAAVVAAPAARWAGVRCAWVKHDHSYDGPLMRVLTGLTDARLATSTPLATASAGPATVIPPPNPDHAPLSPATARAHLHHHGLHSASRESGESVLLVAGRLVAYKGIDDAIRALADGGAAGWRLAVAGEAAPGNEDERARLAALARECGVADRVDLLGYVPGVASLLPGADAVAALTRPDPDGPGGEGFGATVWEALRAGVPVVGTASGPAAALIAPDGEAPAGIVVPPGDPAAVAAALKRLADPAVRAAMGDAGRERTRHTPTDRDRADLLASTLARTAARPGAGLHLDPPHAEDDPATTSTPAVTSPAAPTPAAPVATMLVAAERLAVAAVAGRPVVPAAVSVVVTVRDERGAVAGLVDDLVGQLRVVGDELVVVDGGSTDGTWEVLAERAEGEPRLRVVRVPGAGISAGRNAGVGAARNDLIACTDAGCVPAAGWLEALRAGLVDMGTGGGLVTGVYRVRGGGVAGRALAVVGYPDPAELRWPGMLARGYWRVFGRGFDATMPTGRSVGFQRASWRAAGGFPEDLATGEDVLFGRAVAAAGHPAVVSADAEVEWEQRAGVAATAVMYFRYGQGSGRSRDRRLLGRDLARAAAYLVAPVVLVLGGPAARVAVLAGAAAYLSLPWLRAARGEAPLRTAVLVPAAAALRDLAKAAGALHALATGSRPERADVPAGTAKKADASAGPAREPDAPRVPAGPAWEAGAPAAAREGGR